MMNTVMTILSALSAFATVSADTSVINVFVEDVVLTSDWDEVVPDAFDDSALDSVYADLDSLANSVEHIPYAHDVFRFDGFEVRISYSSYDI